MIARWIFALSLLCLGMPAIGYAQPNKDAARGELLYTTHCITCHSTQIHWRDKKIARDLTGLNAQVRRWQEIAGLKWGEDDIAEVTRYLNTLHYHYP